MQHLQQARARRYIAKKQFEREQANERLQSIFLLSLATGLVAAVLVTALT